MDDAERSQAPPESCVDWRGRPCRPRHGGMRAAAFVLVFQASQTMALAAVGSNLITFVFGELHFPLPQAANVVTNFVGTVFILSPLGGFLSDSYAGCLRTLLAFAAVELAGLVLLAVQAHLPQLRSAPCNMLTMEGSCERAGGTRAAVFFVALYLVALGAGCVMPNMTAYGGDQFAAGEKGAKRLSTYFNLSYLGYCVAEVAALTAVVWAQTRFGMAVGFGLAAAALGAGLLALASGAAVYRNKPPRGSVIFTPIARVFVAAFSKRKQICPSGSSNPAHTAAGDAAAVVDGGDFRHANKFRDAADTVPESEWRLCTAGEVRQTKTLLAVLPIVACTVVTNTVLAQLQTFSVQQGSAMDTRLAPSSFRIPPASLQAIPYAMLLALVPAYELLLVPLARRLTGARAGIAPLQRIGVGLCLVALSMASAAAVERRRRDAAVPASGGRRQQQLSVLWLVPQFFVFGLSELFTNVGLMEFFYEQASSTAGTAAHMQAFFMAFFYCSFSFGFYLSSVLVSLVNRATAGGGRPGWLGDNDLNKDRLDLFYWVLAALSVLNFFCYLLCARWYNSGAAGSGPDGAAPGGEVASEEEDDGKGLI
uniref:Protein NRT1/ PTR FAMILY 4.3 n=1 Tax=Zea mays TaxID=4577 RepID=A0A804NM67_MAIZE